MEMKTMTMDELQGVNGGQNTATIGGTTYTLPDGFKVGNWTDKQFEIVAPNGDIHDVNVETGTVTKRT